MILFIGRAYYLDGFQILLKAFEILLKFRNNLELNVIGLVEGDVIPVVGTVPKEVVFHGF